jgi:chromosome segregation ATPase
MSTDTNSAEESAPQRSTDPDQIEAEIESTREDLSDTVDALSRKLDVKAQANDRVDEVKARALDARDRAQATWADPESRSEIIAKAAPVAGALAGVLVLLGVVRRVRS